MATLFGMKGVPFKPAAYEKAAQSIEAMNKEVADLYREHGRKGLLGIPGVGAGIADHIEEMISTSHFKEYEKLKKETPVDIQELTAIEGVGPKMIGVLWKKLKIRTVKDLEAAARAGKIKRLPHFGERSEQKILKGIELLKQSGARRPLAAVLPQARSLEQLIRSFPGVKEVVIAGSLRRQKETIGDLDILVIANNPQDTMERFAKMPSVSHVYDTGPTKTNVRLRNGLDADLRIVPPESFGAALNYFTGNKEHNIALREIATKKGWKLNEYGLFSGKRMIAGKTEEELYKKLGLSYIEPELRENTGEIEASRKGALPKLVTYEDLKGDLQVQTDWTDGADSIEDMAQAAIQEGLEYIVITDHTVSLAMTGGSDEKKLLRQVEEIGKLNKKLKAAGKQFIILTGAEVNIGKDGSLDIRDDVLAQLDVVGASVHSHFRLSREEQTKRVIKAIENPNVDIIFHLTGRLLARREPTDLDIDAVIAAAKRTGTVMEVNGSPERLDIKDDYVRQCLRAGVKLSIDSDAHGKKQYAFLRFGVMQARRGWAQKKDVVNTRPLKEFLKCLKPCS